MGIYPDSPSPPDPEETAAAQFNYNIGATQAGGITNNPNTYDPYGQTEYTLAGYETVYLPDGKSVQVPRYNQNTTLTPQGQKILNQQQNLADKSYTRASGLLSTPSTQGVNPWQTGYQVGNLRDNFRGNTRSQTFNTRGIRQRTNLKDTAGTGTFRTKGNRRDIRNIQTNYAKNKDFSSDRARVENAMMGRASKLLGESRDAEVARLAAMGLAPGTEAYGRVSDQFENSANDLAMQAVLAGGQEQSRLLGEDRMRADFRNQALGQRFGQRMGLIGAENQRLMGETGLFNAAQQGEFAMKTALREMENARRAGDMQAYNAALQAYNNTQLAQTQMNRDQANFNNQVRGAQVGETEAIKNAEINRLIGILTGGQVQNPNIPGYFTQATGAPDYSGLVQNNYNQQVGQYNNFWKGITDIAGAGVDYAAGRWG